jgi:hypothetical protein
MGKNRLVLHWVTILVIALFAFLAISSATTARPGVITIDPDLPKEKSAVVVFHSSINVKEYNGINVKGEWYPKGEWRKLTATIPAGETHLLFDIHASFDRGNTTYSFRPKDLELKFDFEAGREYTMSIYASKNEGNFLFPKQKVVLAIWDKIYSDANPGNKEGDHVIKSWELGEF